MRMSETENRDVCLRKAKAKAREIRICSSSEAVMRPSHRTHLRQRVPCSVA